MRAGGGALRLRAGAGLPRARQEQGCRGRGGRAARWVSVYGMLILVAPTALAVGSGINSTRIVSTKHHHLGAVSGESSRQATVKPRWADGRRAVPVLGGARA